MRTVLLDLITFIASCAIPLLSSCLIYGQDGEIPPVTTNLVTIARIESSDFGIGSGFLVHHSNSLFLVTARHVLFGKSPTNTIPSKSYEVRLSRNILPENPSILTVEFNPTNVTNSAIARTIIRRDSSHDIAAIKLGALSPEGHVRYSDGVKENISGGNKLFMVLLETSKRFSDTVIAEEVFTWGFPSVGRLQLNGGPMFSTDQWDFHVPLVSKGIISGKDSRTSRLLLQCPVFPGNSGGPVFMKQLTAKGLSTGYKISPIGVVSERVLFQDAYVSIRDGDVRMMENQHSGYSVIESMDSVIEMLQEWLKDGH